MKKTTRLKNLLYSGELTFICESHNPLSARIVEQAGFEGLWASGFSISAQLGLRDNNEASWTQVLDLIELMSDATSVPILMDGDTGYGNFNNVQRLIRKAESRSIAGVCIEDKVFPKTSSFIDGPCQPLAEIDEFRGKIRAAKDAQSDPDFCVVARTEAFITKQGLREAIRRADAYHRAGADAILVHSALSTPDEVIAFKREWQDRSPVIIVPTTYYSTPVTMFRDAGFSMVIWANQILRASVRAMQRAASDLFQQESIASMENQIASLEEVFRLQRVEDLREAERRYLPASSVIPPKGDG